jgi:hypothetical protein
MADVAIPPPLLSPRLRPGQKVACAEYRLRIQPDCLEHIGSHRFGEGANEIQLHVVVEHSDPAGA